jgi:hypothetical protein
MSKSNKTNKQIDLSKIEITNGDEIVIKQNNKLTFKELQEAAKPLVDILYKYYDPHTIIIIDQGHVEILCEDMTAPIELRD